MVKGVLLKLYLKIRQNEVKKAKVKLRKMNIDTILWCLTKNCWGYGVQYDVLIKTQNYFIVKLFGRKKNLLIKYHKTDLVSVEDYDSFMYDLNLYEAHKGIYITSGEFEVTKSNFFYNKIIIVDNTHFIKYQLGFWDTTENVFYKKKLKFFKYLEI